MQMFSAKSLQSCPTLCDPIDGSPPGSPIPGILQARTLEWVAISFSKMFSGRTKFTGLYYCPVKAATAMSVSRWGCVSTSFTDKTENRLNVAIIYQLLGHNIKHSAK